MSKKLLVQVTVIEDEMPHEMGGRVIETSIFDYDGSYGYEVLKMFQILGEKYVRVIDPSYGP